MSRESHMILVDYDPNWITLFNAEKERLHAAVGEYVLTIEHIGSTSVPNLAAKPVIDITIGVESLAIADEFCVPTIQSLEYEYVAAFEDMMPRRRYFRRSDEAGMRTHQIHLWELADSEYERHIVFRDYLRAHLHEAQAYEAVKRNLMAQLDKVNDYADAKSVFIKPCEARAYAWHANLIANSAE